jgi:hypothetical protein
MDIKKLKTSQLLDKVEDTGDDDVLFGELIDEIDERTPFAYIEEKIQGLEKEVEKLNKEMHRTGTILKAHKHQKGGEATIGISVIGT